MVVVKVRVGVGIYKHYVILFEPHGHYLDQSLGSLSVKLFISNQEADNKKYFVNYNHEDICFSVSYN